MVIIWNYRQMVTGDHPQFERLQDAKNYIKQLVQDDIDMIKDSLRRSMKTKLSDIQIRY